MKFSTKKIAYTALMTAVVIISTVVLGISNGETYTNLGDTAIFITAVLLGPLPAFIAGGLGSFFADMMVFPLTMWVTLIIKGFEGLICGLLIKGIDKLKGSIGIKTVLTVISMIVSGLFMMGGYFIAETFIYGSIAGAIYALAANAVQAAFSVVLASILIFGMKLIKHKVNFGAKKNLMHKESENSPTFDSDNFVMKLNGDSDNSAPKLKCVDGNKKMNLKGESEKTSNESDV